MPKFIAHALMGASVVAAIHPNTGIKQWIPLLAGAVLAVSPDFDLAIEKLFDLPSFHRGFSHSLLFSAFVGVIIWGVMHNYGGRAVLALSFAYMSHAVLDFFTSTKGGIKLFYPFSTDYYNEGLTNLFESPLGATFTEVLKWISIETVCFLPVLIIILMIKELKT